MPDAAISAIARTAEFRIEPLAGQATPGTDSTTGAGFGKALGGVEATAITQDPNPGRRVYDPSNPDADTQGYVTLPNVDTVTEMVDLITAQRGYDANVQALNAAKQMFQKALDLLR